MKRLLISFLQKRGELSKLLTLFLTEWDVCFIHQQSFFEMYKYDFDKLDSITQVHASTENILVKWLKWWTAKYAIGVQLMVKFLNFE